nr:reticulon-3 isoform X2 [Doryrhamphus excisus]
MLPDSPEANPDAVIDKRSTWAEDLDPAEARDVDSSGESDETVIEDGFNSVTPPPKSDFQSNDTTCPETSPPTEEMVMPPARSERKLMQVPTINVIETEEPNCSDDEMEFEAEEEDYEVVNQGPKTAEPIQEDHNEVPTRRPLETEFMEGYSPPSSPVDSEDEYSPKQNIVKSPPDIIHEEPNPEKSKTIATSSSDVHKVVDLPDKDEWSIEAKQSLTEEDRTDFTGQENLNNKTLASFSKSFMRDDTYDGQSFDYEPLSPFCEVEITPKGAKDRFLADSSEVDSETQDASHHDDETNKSTSHRFSNNTARVTDNCERPTEVQPHSKVTDRSLSEPVDSFVEFMRECLKSKEGEEPADNRGVPSEEDYVPRSPPTMVMDFEQEQLTISALKQLGYSQEEDDHAALSQQSSVTPVANAPHTQSNTLGFDGTYSEEVEAIDIWVAEAYHLAEHVLTAILTHVSVKDLIHWRDPKKSGLVFGLSMLLLLSLAAFSVISVVSYLLLALLCVTITFRIYKSVVQAVQKSSEGHPFKSLIDKDVSIPPETFRKQVDVSLTYINRALKQMSRLFLVEDLVDSLKLAVVMWLLTYVGAVFNGITILILADILLFAVPPIYEKNKTQIDQYIDLARTQINTTIAKLQEKLPGAVKRSKTE